MDLSCTYACPLSLAELDSKVRMLWQEHDALDEEVLNLRKRTEEAEQRMQQVAAEALALRQCMRTLTPDSLEDLKALLKVIEEDVYHLSLLEGGDEQMIAGILKMVKAIHSVL